MRNRVLTKVLLIRDFIRDEREQPVPLRLIDRLRAWKDGMTSYLYAAYHRSEGYSKEYLSSYARLKAQNILGPYKELLISKVSFELVMRHYVRVPRNLAIIVQGRVLPLQDEVRLDSADALIELARREPIVIKPVRGSLGAGVCMLTAMGSTLFVNNRELPAAEVRKLISGMRDHVVTEFVRQAAYAARIFPRATNTIRLMTIVDPETLEPFIASAVQKIGTEASAPVDNSHVGGISAPVDLDSGTLGPAMGRKADTSPMWYERHPDTGAQIEGVQVTHWSMIKEGMLRTLRLMPYLQYVGWDVVATDDGFQVIEGNSMPGLFQGYSPFLRDPRVRKFFHHHGIV